MCNSLELNSILGVGESLIVANDVSMPIECFPKMLEKLSRCCAYLANNTGINVCKCRRRPELLISVARWRSLHPVRAALHLVLLEETEWHRCLVVCYLIDYHNVLSIWYDVSYTRLQKNHVKTRKLTALLKTSILNQGYTWNTQYSTTKVAFETYRLFLLTIQSLSKISYFKEKEYIPFYLINWWTILPIIG